MTKHYDVAIVGGGLVGLMAANLIAQETNFSVALIERKKPQFEQKTAYDLRTSAISFATKNLFSRLGLWQSLQQSRHGYYKSMQVWDADGFGRIIFNAEEVFQPILGWIFENSTMLEVLWKSIEENEQVDVVFDNIDSLQPTTSQVDIHLTNHNTISCQLLVGADGGDSWVRQQLGFNIATWSYQQRALVATIKTAKPHRLQARQRFRQDGPLAFLPLAEDDLCSIVWSTHSEHAEQLVKMPEQDFNDKLYREFDGELGEVTVQGPRASFPLRRIHSDYVQPRVALIGDAAHVIHPLAGQGVNLGFLDAAALTEVLSGAESKGQSIGDYLVLRRYERQRKAHNKLIQTCMDGFYQGFGSQNSLVKFIRSFGLTATNKLPWLKRELIELAMGLKGDIPKLCT